MLPAAEFLQVCSRVVSVHANTYLVTGTQLFRDCLRQGEMLVLVVVHMLLGMFIHGSL